MGSPVKFSVTTANIGYLFTPSASLTLYDGVVDGQHMIGSGTVDLRDFEAESVLTWTAAGAGSHTIIAYADADRAIAETNESDNTATIGITVSNGQVPGVPDLAVNEGDIGLDATPQAGQPTTVKVRLRNVGEVAASSIGVRVADNGAPVSDYTVTSIAAGSDHVQSVSWTPAADGAHFLNVTADYGSGIRELDEDNNVALMRIGVDPIPGPACLYNGQTVFQPVYRDEYVVLAGDTDVYVGCLVIAWNVTVYGTLRLLNGSTLVVGKSYPLGAPWPFPVPIPFPYFSRHSVRVENGGLMELLDSRMTARMATYGYGFEAKVGSAFYQNRSVAQFPWGTWPIPLDGGIAPGGLIIRTTNFAFRDSTVAYGRLHGVYLAPGLSAGVLVGDTLLGNNAAGLAVDLGAVVTASASAFRGNRFGLLAAGSSPVVSGSLLTANRYGLKTQGSSSALLTQSQVVRNVVAGAFFGNASAGAPRITQASSFDHNRFGAYALASNLTVDNSTFYRDSQAAVFDGASSALVENNPSMGSLNFTVTAANVSSVRIAGRVGISYMYWWESDYVAGVTYMWTAFVCEKSSVCRVLDGATFPGVCDGIQVLSASDLDIGNSTVAHVGCGNQLSLLVRDSRAAVYGSTMGGDQSIVATNAILSVRNSTLVARMSVTASERPVLEDNNVTGRVSITSSSDVVFHRNLVRADTGLVLLGSANASVVDNVFEGVHYWSPTNRPGLGDPPTGYGPSNRTLDNGLIEVYNNATATILRNRLSRGAWGISLDDRTCASCPNYRSTYALIENNSIDDNGFLAVGVDSTSRADIRNNWINRSSGWAIAVESGYPLPSNPGGPGNTVTGNWVNDTNGRATYWRWDNSALKWVFTGSACDVTTVQLFYEPNAYRYRGQAEVWNNHISRTNATGIRVCYDKAVYVHDNVIDGGGVVQNGTFAGPSEAGVTIHSAHPGPSLNRLQGNDVSGFAMGLWVKTTTAGWDVSGNHFTGNRDGVRVGYGDVANGYAWANLHDNWMVGNVAGLNVSSWEYVWWGNVSGVWAWYADLYAANATLRYNTITENTNGVYVTFNVSHNDTIIVRWTTLEPYVTADRNTVTGNTFAGVYLRGIVWNGTTYPVYANLTGNNTIASNGYGVWIDGPTVDPTANHFWLWWNDVRGNSQPRGGVYVNGNPQGHWGSQVFFRAYCNWWNDASGPNDPTDPISGPPDQNQFGTGQPVSDFFWYRQKPPTPPPLLGWLNRTSGDPLAACTGGV